MASMEENFLQERLTEMRAQDPRAGQLTDDLFTLCMPLAKRPAQAGKLEGWLRQFVKDGAFSQLQADVFWQRATDLVNAP